MKLGKVEKIMLGICVIFVLWAIVHSVVYSYRIKHNRHPLYFITPFEETNNLPENIKQLSKKYKAYENMYNSDEKVFTYGYQQYSTNSAADGTKFHKALRAKIAEEGLDNQYKIVVYQNWVDYDNDVEKLNSSVYEGDGTKCMMSDPSVEELDNLRLFSKNCLRNSCIIDTKNNKYTMVSKNHDMIIENLKKHAKD